eukprot:CAMPEP_0175115360 /NCGR_PEP_ID=MMETSP0086_2-20121207/17515_1 /TAXON_ID=136419 /ORGANISM="Unknown Unknown, Strain D1" /LENGTH=242 /DNA_ID=CAMNT_0016395405 /DNA_START=52 /DNA_END=780 /DNA_ORIENTATION=+
MAVSAHIRWVIPKPRSDGTGLKSYPCGGIAPSQTKVALAPGPMIVEWEETINHNGAPFRIAISTINDTNFDQLVLVDHLVHNDAGGGSFTNPKPYKLSLTIPDINCPSCVLQLVNPMTDKESGLCDYPTKITESKCFSVYHSCADISIAGNADPATFISTWSRPPYKAYGKESGTPQEWVQQSDGSWQYFPPAAPTTATSPTNNPSDSSAGTTLMASFSLCIFMGAAFSLFFPEQFDVLSAC